MSHRLPGGPAAGWFYGRDLADGHDAAFGHLARGGARTLLGHLGRAGIRDGLVVDLGAGSGITARVLTDAGYQVLDAELPACVAVTAIGECLNYAADPGAGRERLGGLFARVHQALGPGGLFLFDVAEPGREGRGPRRSWHEGPDWLLCYEAVEEPKERVLRRRITLFRQAGGGWRRSDELHTLRLYRRREVLDELVWTGFQPRLLAGYGGEGPQPGLDLGGDGVDIAGPQDGVLAGQQGKARLRQLLGQVAGVARVDGAVAAPVQHQRRHGDPRQRLPQVELQPAPHDLGGAADPGVHAQVAGEPTGEGGVADPARRRPVPRPWRPRAVAAAGGKLGLDQIFLDGPARLLEAGHLGLGDALGGHVGQGGPPPHGQRGSQRLRRPQRLVAGQLGAARRRRGSNRQRASVEATSPALTAGAASRVRSSLLPMAVDERVCGRLVLVGDAAHATSPNMAEGAGMAIEDALVLAECLAVATGR